MDGWSLLEGLPDDGYSTLEKWRLRLDDDGDPAGFASFAAACFERAGTAEVRAAFDVLDGPWSSDWRFRGFVGWLMLQGEAIFDSVVGDPERLAGMDFPDDAQDFVMALLEIGMQLPPLVSAASGAVFTRLAAWRQARFQPEILPRAAAEEVRRRLLEDGRCDAGPCGRFRVRRRQGGVAVTFKPGAPFRGEPWPDDEWATWFRPMRDAAAEHREFVAPDLGAFRIVHYPSRTGRNPVSGETFQIPELLLPRFRAAPDLLSVLRTS
jgi:nucleoid DNA-binding protein